MPEKAPTLFGESEAWGLSLPTDYSPLRPPSFDVARIVLAKGSQSTPERRRFVQSICALYPSASLIERPDLPHNRVALGEADPVALHREGVRTLVFGELKSAVRKSEETGNTCPNYWHFSVYGYCFYGCAYCYLAGTRGIWHSPTVKIYVNLPEIVGQIDRTANRLARPVAFYLGKLQDGLALDPLTSYSTVLVTSFARHPFARQVSLTKSDAVGRLLGLDHGGHTTLSWSLNPPDIAMQFEANAPPVEARIEAMRAVAEAGYPVRAVVMPLIPVPGWERKYDEFLRDLLSRVPIERLTFGGICSYANARRLLERKLGSENVISRHIAGAEAIDDGRARYAQSLRIGMYVDLARVAREARPDIELALCLEDQAVWRAVNAEASLGRCNCVL
jgi:DNA repair photolyase